MNIIKRICATILLSALVPNAIAATTFTCDDLIGKWKAPVGNNQTFIFMKITPSTISSTDSKVFSVQYNTTGTENVDDYENNNNLFCFEGLNDKDDPKGIRPLTVAFENLYGGHSIGTYNDELQQLWAGLLAKDKTNKKFISRMDSFWFTKEQK
ncbi:putativesecreted protein [Moritella sp. JT01]|uniref:hypothetical protein n=1 Tax=Moritella sp. JT01 TaxID=756698 RepID=UPI000793E3DC|nr:hypothetical protein [Moritella sp. JT01]KXO06694.1 putativesecreted protein [Moritella sp. JT01]